MENLSGINTLNHFTQAIHGRKLKKDASGQAQSRQLMDECRQFESVLLNCMLKSMRQTVEKSKLFSGGRAEDIFTSMLDQEYSVLISKKNSTGLAEDLYRQISGNYSYSDKIKQGRTVITDNSI